MLWTAYTGLVFMAVFLQSTENDIIYYIAPNSPSSPNNCYLYQPCITFENFINRYHASKERFTLFLLKGNHTLPGSYAFLDHKPLIIYIFMSYLTMVGITTEVILYDSAISFVNIQEIHISNIILNNGRFLIAADNKLVQISLSSIKLIDYAVYIKDAWFAKLTDCEFISGASPLTAHSSKIALSGNNKFFNNYNSAIISHTSTITFSGTVSFVNNSGIRGGAMALYSSTIYLTNGLNISFINNSAYETGGAIHIEPDMTRSSCPECFYQTDSFAEGITLYYSGNFAKYGGNNIYGRSLASCKKLKAQSYFLSNDTLSSMSSDPTKVCLCDSDGQPQCENVPRILTNKYIHPGERITFPAMIVGGDYGTTIGTVHASFMPTNNYFPIPVLKSSHQYSQWIGDNSVCTDLEYTAYSKHVGQNFTLNLIAHFSKHVVINNELTGTAWCDITKRGYDSNTLTFINLTILPCPVGFNLLGNPPRCDCHPVLTVDGVKCNIENGKSYFSWNSTLWISTNKRGFTYAKYCPLNYCDRAEKIIELENNPYIQCIFNRAGRLCGGCREGYSLAIGSSHCIHCPNNNGLALLIFFAAAGFLLVFFINILDITLTHGLLDGLIFYANVVGIYQSVLFPEQQYTNSVIIFLKTFIDWLNLDFGIETCFIKGLTSYWKTWLQFVFPFYVWAIVGLMVFTAKYSRILTKLYGNRAVPVLATLFLLSYMKLLRTVTSIFTLSHIVQYPNNSTITVWSVDGNMDYFGLPHSFLLVAAVIVQIFLWLPYTLTLLFYQQLQKISHVKLFNWVTNLKPFFDVHFAPFKSAHRYWFGVLLLARGILLTIFTSSFATPKNTNLLLLLILVLILLLYMTIVQPYRNKVILIIQTSFFANILLLSAFVFYAETHENKYTLQITVIGTSFGVIFFQFCGIIICNIIRLCYCTKRNAYRYRAYYEDEDELEENFSTKYRAYIMKALF